MRPLIALSVVLAAAAAATAQPRFYCLLTPSATCDEQVPMPIESDSTTPTQNSFGPFTCTQFHGPGVMTASAFASNGIVGVDIENTWFGCAAFGCGPNLLQISSNARHEFDVVFTSPTSDPIDVIMNLRFSGNIQEASLYRIVIATVTGAGRVFTGRFGQVDSADPDIKEGLLSDFDEITGSLRSTSAFTNVPVNTPVRFSMELRVENATTLVGGGAVNFARGMRLQQTPFTVVGTAGGVSPGDIGIESPDANISGGTYGGYQSCAGDIADATGGGIADGVIDFGDFLALLGLTGPCGAGTGNPDCTGDIADNLGTLNSPDGTVDFGDFLALLGLVGACP